MKSTNTFTPLDENLIKRSRYYAGIGSRSAPQPVLILIRRIASLLAGYGLTLRSGGAPGADSAFEQGCDRARGKKEIFLPRKDFNRNPSPFHEPLEEAEILASLHHPRWSACSPAGRKLHARNCQQICGQELSIPVDFVVFWASEQNGTIKGGTATAVSLAREMRIPTFNLANESTRKAWMLLARAYEQRSRNFWRNILNWIGEEEQPKQ